jgi:hypothetical protein
MPSIAKQYHPVYNDKGKLIAIPDVKQTRLKTVAVRTGYPFHILKTYKDSFIVKDLELERSLRVQASKQGAAAGVHYSVSYIEGVGLVVKKVKP